MRTGLEIIQEWILTGSRVPDLGCGDGEPPTWLYDHRQVSGYGLEVGSDNIARCTENGVNVIKQGLDKNLGNFASDSFNMVVMAQALQAVHYPDRILEEMLRVGKTCIITSPNFGHWRRCWYLVRNGRMPVPRFLSYAWYNTPNIYLCIFQNFERLYRQLRMRALDHLAIDCDH